MLLKDAAAALADQPWFRDTLEGMGNSLLLAFLVAVFLRSIVQSASAVCVVGISMAAVGVISIDQAIMIMFGSGIGSSVILYLLSINLTGRSRQVAFFVLSRLETECNVFAGMEEHVPRG